MVLPESLPQPMREVWSERNLALARQIDSLPGCKIFVRCRQARVCGSDDLNDESGVTAVVRRNEDGRLIAGLADSKGIIMAHYDTSATLEQAMYRMLQRLYSAADAMTLAV